MIARLVLLALALVAVDAPRADACCLGCPCTKYQPKTVRVQQPVYSYTHSIKGALPTWSVARISAFLVRGTWTPVTKAPPGGPGLAPPPPPSNDGTRIDYVVEPAVGLRFFMADQAGKIPAGLKQRAVLIRRIEKHERAIIVEVDSQVWKLAACPKKPGFACLVPTNGITLAPIDPPQ